MLVKPSHYRVFLFPVPTDNISFPKNSLLKEGQCFHVFHWVPGLPSWVGYWCALFYISTVFLQIGIRNQEYLPCGNLFLAGGCHLNKGNKGLLSGKSLVSAFCPVLRESFPLNSWNINLNPTAISSIQRGRCQRHPFIRYGSRGKALSFRNTPHWEGWLTNSQTSSCSQPKLREIKGKVALKCKSGVWQKGLLGEISIRSSRSDKRAEPRHDVIAPLKKARHPEPVYLC